MAAILNLAAYGCQPASTAPSGDPRAKFTPKAYPYEMAAERKTAFLEGVRTLRSGQQLNEVVRLLGPADRQYTISAKEHDRPLGERITYYLRKKGDGVNEHFDQSVSVDFDVHDRLASLGIQNLPDLTDQITNLPVSATYWNERTGEIESTVKRGDQREHNR
jgi:hypothetical protein